MRRTTGARRVWQWGQGLLGLALAVGLAGCPAKGPEPATGPEAGLPRAAARDGRPHRLTPLFPDRVFPGARGLAVPPDGSRRIFVFDRLGRVVVWPGAPGDDGPRVFFDLGPRLGKATAGRGLQSLAFHPRFAANRTLVYTAVIPGSPPRLVLARLQADAEDPSRAAPGSETELLEVELPFGEHPGGALAFGADGLLYVGTGDGGGVLDPKDLSGDRRSRLGKILRLDVDLRGMTTEYTIPAGNPYVGNRDDFDEAVYASGFADVRAIVPDSTGHAFWVADATDGLAQEVDRLTSAGDYGWPLRAGAAPTARRAERTRPDLLAPAASYGAPAGTAIAGLAIYRGQAWPALRGELIVADRGSGRVWALRPGGRLTELAQVAAGVVGMGLDPEGEPLFVGGDGRILRLD